MNTPAERSLRQSVTRGWLNARNLTALLLLALCGAAIAILPLEQLTFFVSDDAYYYLNVARNITHGAGSSFDGINPSNGYHPLWMLCLLPVYGLFGDSPDAAFRMALLLQALLVSGTFWMAWDLYERHAPASSAVGVALAIAGSLYSPLQIMFNGLETDLVVFVLVLVVYADAGRSFLDGSKARSQQALFGALLGSLMLARLDGAFLLVGITIWCLARPQPRSMVARVEFLLRSFALTVVVFAAVVAPYFVWNYVLFGHLSPISGTLKATFPHMVFRTEVLTTYAPYVICTLLAGLALIPMHRRPDPALRGAHLHLLTGLWIGCLLQLVWAVCFTSWGTFQWHFAAHIPVTCLILSFYAARLFKRPAPAIEAFGAAALLIFVVAFNVFTYNNKGDYHESAFAAANWARSNTAPGTVFALRDAGIFGYFSERPTINLDGLINSYEYQQYVRDGRLMDFLNERKVEFVADTYSACEYTERHVWVRSYMPPRPPLSVAYGLTVTRDHEAFRSNASVFMPLTLHRPICFIVWPFDSVTYQVRDASISVRE
jgi:hypothetical protein